MAAGRRPTTDTGTVVAHTLIVLSFVVLLLTGLRIASDDPEALWLVALDPLLPVEQLWYRHMVAAVVLVAVLMFHMVYLRRARLGSRVRLDASRFVSLLNSGRPRRMALNTIVCWGLIGSLVVEIVTGTLVFFEIGGPSLAIHRTATWVLIGFVVTHIACHIAIGGGRQLLRILRPAPLVVAPPPPDLAQVLATHFALAGGQNSHPQPLLDPENETKPRSGHPAVLAVGVAVVTIIAALVVEQATRQVLHVVEIGGNEAPSIDGDLSHPVWAKAPPVRIVTTQGGDFGGSGSSTVEVRALHDERYAYFAFVWDDPTRSLKHLPLSKTADGWKVLSGSADHRAEAEVNEDKFSVLLSRSVFPLIGAAIHLSPSSLGDHPASTTGRGLHYTPDGSIADVWVWRASHGCSGGHIDNAHFGGAAQSRKSSEDGVETYAGGFALDPGPMPYRSNIGGRRPDGTVTPARLPLSPTANAAQLGRLTTSPGESDTEGSRWWMKPAESVPYATEHAAKFAVGSIIPGVLCADTVAVGDASVRGVARWASGRWTLEIVRRLYTGSRYDLPIKSGILMWVAAFDHAETRHSRYLRPLRLEVD